jgi:hypothetical protein
MSFGPLPALAAAIQPGKPPLQSPGERASLTFRNIHCTS